jgi:hypothetical protein
MGQVLHGSATTTEAVRRAIQRSQESLRALARRSGVNAKWTCPAFVESVFDFTLPALRTEGG